LIERHPVFRRAMERLRIELLKAREREALLKVVVLHEMHKKKSEFMFLPGGVHSITPMDCRQVEVIVNGQTAHRT